MCARRAAGCRGAGTLQEGDAITKAVLGDEFDICGDQRPQIFAEGDVDRRAIVQRADAHAQNMTGGLAGFVGQRVDEVGVQRPLGQVPVPLVASRIRSAVRRSTMQEGIVDRGHEDRAADMHLRRVLIVELADCRPR